MNIKQILKYIENGLIFKIVKFLILSTLMIYLFIFFVFNVTYMNTNKFFSYDLLSFECVWILIYVLLVSCIFSIFALPMNVISYYHTCKKGKDILYYTSLSIVILYIVIVVLSILFFDIKNDYWIYFYPSIILLYFLLTEIGIDFYINKKLGKTFGLLALFFALIVWMAITIPNLFNAAFSKFLTNQGLAAEKVEIYLKNKNKFVIGKMLFKDSQFAYVEYKDNIQINHTSLEQNISQSIPINDISILR